MERRYDVIVIGGGHAGCEAAHASARMGAKTLLLTTSIPHLALMPCNPAIGGPGKGHLVREIDALGGLMAKVTDLSTIHIRKVNTGKGPAVQTLRAQTQRDLYSSTMRKFLESTPHLYLFQGEATKILQDKEGKVKGVKVKNQTTFFAPAVVLCTGTFLNGVVKIGELSYPAGREGEFPSVELGHNLREMGLQSGRLSTCSPPRLDRRTIDFSSLEEQKSDEEPLCFSFTGFPQVYKGASVFIARTSRKTCDIIKANFHRSPLLYPASSTSSVRECPSLEDKVYRFPERDQHLLFLEPEGKENNEIYVQGLFTSLPEEIQWEIVHSIAGLERAHLIRPGYGIEYDYILPTQLRASLECQEIPGLFLAGQINGTSGYEEAAGQGIIAGINAASYVKGRSPLILRRDESYIGVMIDDLVTKGVDEPYRLRTGKVEFRLVVRHSNADLRLGPHAYEREMITEKEYRRIEEKRDKIQREIERLSRLTIFPTPALQSFLTHKGTNPVKEAIKASDLLARPEITYRDLAPFDRERPFLEPQVIEEVEIEIKYRGYIERQKREIEEFKKMESKIIPPNFDFSSVQVISREAREKLQKVRPATLGQAARVAGVTPSDIAALSILLEK
ncbi:MAG TPA: tRNA uridine-5-carboxymethylaminomethyl(34) synthesis enzyme MnmG [Candidatus Atribacteria bacterium]|nr:tRNA uridine-5-carboxymethylaminomethyl(34) synthesis enzyme MnmG [Candidatus Atribacteria bacterium]